MDTFDLGLKCYECGVKIPDSEFDDGCEAYLCDDCYNDLVTDTYPCGCCMCCGCTCDDWEDDLDDE